MIQIALIARNGSNVGVVGHDTSTGRVIYKFNPGSELIADLITIWTNRSLISETRELEDVVIRSRVINSEKDYLKSLLSKSINPPYKVKYIEEMGRGDLSKIILNEFKELM